MTNTNSSIKYRNEIDGLRALAVIPVIFFHAGFEIFKGGFVGVDIFFVISGYLITSLIIQQIDHGEFSLLNFYERRVRRLLPALFVVLGTCIPIAIIVLTPPDLVGFGKSLISTSTFSSNFLFWRESGYFAAQTELKPLLHTWSLAVEEQYYILFPIFLILTWRIGINNISLILILIFLISLCLSFFISNKSPNAAFFLLPTRGWEILIGVFTALYLKKYDYFRSNLFNQILCVIGISLIVLSIVYFDHSTPFPSIYALIPTIGTSIIIISAVPNTFLHKILSLKFLVSIGLISYSAYLWHQPLFAFTRHFLFDQVSDYLYILLSLISFLLAFLTWKLIENPFRSNDFISKKFVLIFCAIGTLMSSTIGFLFIYKDGYVRNYNDSEFNVYKSFDEKSSYVTKRFQENHLKEFNSDNLNKNKLVLIGDSFAQDLLNAIYESGLDEIYDVTTYRIPVDCGVLMVKQEKLREYNAQGCDSLPSFENNKLHELIKTADQVWISSSWPSWSVKFMSESIKNIKQYNNKISVFGIKNLGYVDSRIYKNFSIDIWSDPDYFVEKDYFTNIDNLNKSLEEKVVENDVKFVNSQKIICNGEIKCSNYVNGKLISYDGFHLTPYGAELFGNELKKFLLTNI